MTFQHSGTLNKEQSIHLSTLLDTPPEEIFDRFTRLASMIIGTPVALISLVTEDRQFFKSQIGLPEPWASDRETPLSHSFCQHVAATNEPLLITDARLHPLVNQNLAIRDLGVIAYAGIPLTTPEGTTIGSFCAIDVKPREWTRQEIEILTELAHSVMTEISLRIMAKHLQDSYVALRQTEIERDEMVHMLVHDLRTPLNSLLGGLQVLEALMAPDDLQREMLDISLRGGRSLAQMVDSILDVVRGEASASWLKKREATPAALIESAREQVTQLSRQQGISMLTDLPTNLPPLFADADKLVRVLVNLLGNAIQHTPAGGRIIIKADVTADNSVLFSIADTGSGIPESEFQKIFEKFGQGSGTSTSRASTGLGLTFCKMVIEGHGGRIWLESEVGSGSTFFFTIPLVRG